ncbi:MAG: carboxypeptidase regulatory-like domain-containing protein [Herpetosiphonaceae bacterium]|nr:carboxypeptidase regulatory-like domain-containing protein [Herpetosiphonaceae bacterium]
MRRFSRTLNTLALCMVVLALLPQSSYARLSDLTPPQSSASVAAQQPDFLAPLVAASIPISGTISDARTGWTLYARVELSGPTTIQTYTDSVSGFYRLDVATAGTYTLKAYSVSSGYLVGSRSINVTSAGGVFDLQLQVDARSCVATGYRRDTAGVFEQFSTSVMPAGWSVVDNYTNQGVWRFDNPKNRANLTGGSGGFATADNDIYGGLTTLDTELRSPAYDFSASSTVTVQFDTDLKRDWAPYGGTRGYIDISIDNGATWTTVRHLGEAYRGWVNVDVSDLAAGKSQVRMRLHFISHAGSNWWQVDNLGFGVACNPLAGRLVVGHVYDANTNAGVNGATVAVSTTHKVTTLATPLDPRTDDGFYSLFVPQASQPITASAPWGYASDVRTPPAGAGTVRQDFTLQAGRLVLLPLTLAQTLTMGLESTSAFSVTNIGTLPVNLALDRGPAGASQPTAAWARTAPLSLTLAPNASRVVTVTLDAGDPSIVQPVLHTTRLVVANNDPYPTLALPVTLAVTPLADWGLLTGSVRYLSVCEQSGWPFANAPLTIASSTGITWTTSTNQSGRYSWWADPQAGSYSVSASWYNYVPQTASGLIVTAQATTTHNINLRPNHSCWKLQPPVTSLAATVTLGMTGTVSLPLQNTGAQSATLEIVSSTGSAIAWMPGLPATTPIEADSLRNVPLLLDARTSAVKQPGVSNATLTVRQKPKSGSYTHPPINVPVRLNVVPPPDWSRIEGTVSRIDSCGLNPLPLAGATITVANRSKESFTVTSAVSGTYRAWFDPATGPLTMTVQAPQYLSQTLTGISGTPGGSQTRDVTLRQDGPCAGIQPSQINQTLPVSASQVVPVTLSNTGSKPLDFTLLEAGPLGARDRIEVLVYGTDPVQNAQMRTDLLAYPGVGVVDTWDAGWNSGVPQLPPLSKLKGYDVVISVRSPHYGYPDSEGLGNVLADYVDDGGKVIVMAASWDWDGIAGRFTSGGYNPFVPITADYGYPMTLGEYDSSHPLMRGVSSATSYVFNRVGPAPGATLIAKWQIGYAMLATTPGVVAINAASNPYGPPWAGDLPRLLQNSLYYLLGNPWLSVAPATGTVAPGASTVISVTLSSMVSPALESGVFSTTLLMAPNQGPNLSLPVTLTVTPRETWGELKGKVSGLAQCDRPGAPLARATVIARGSNGSVWSSATRADGSYSVWIDQAASPVTLTVSRTGYLQHSEANIQIQANTRITRDVDLRHLTPCLTVQPATVELTATLDTRTTIPLTITNSGAAGAAVTVTDEAPWLTATPASLNIGRDSSKATLLEFDAGSVSIEQSGVYTTILRLASPTAPGHQFAVPVRFTVLPSSSTGTLRGQVAGLGYCGVPAGPLAQARVVIQDRTGGSWVQQTNASGQYSRQVDSALSPYVVTVSSSGYLTRTFSNVQVGAQAVVTRDAALRWNAPCVRLSPDTATVSLAAGAAATRPFTLTNQGPAGSPFNIQAIQDLDVLVVEPQTFSNGVWALLAGHPSIRTLDRWDPYVLAQGIPSLEVLRPYDVVVAIGNNLVDGIAMGDVLADYVDAGGSVIITSFNEPYGTGGRLFSGGYSPLNGAGSLQDGDVTLGTYTSAHPIMRNISSMSSYYRYSVTPAAGAEVVARWSNNEEFIAVKNRVVAINGYMGQYIVDHPNAGLVFYNALNYLQPVRWLSVAPRTGTLAPDGSLPLSFTFDAVQVSAPGWYTATLSLLDADERNAATAGPIRMFVEPPAGFGLLRGQVRGLTACNRSSAPLKFARVKVVSSTGASQTLITDPNGVYSAYLPIQAQYRLEASHDGYVPTVKAGVVLAPNTPAEHVLDLQLPESCVSTTQTAIDVVLTAGTTATHQLVLGNSGGIDGWVTLDKSNGQDRQLTPLPYPLAWDDMAPYPVAVMYAAAAELDGKIYVTGGAGDINRNIVFDTAHVYDPQTNAWTPIASMSKPRYSHQLLAAGGRLYAIGGGVEMYDPALDQWHVVPGIVPTNIAAAAVIADKIYVVDYCDTPCTADADVFRYDPAAATWTRLAGYPGRKYVGACAALSGALYCIENEGQATFRYQPENNVWSRVANMPEGRIGPYVTTSNGMLLVAGYSDNYYAGNLQMLAYDPFTNTWTRRSESAFRRNGAAIACGTYAIGGTLNTQFSASNSVQRLHGLYPCDEAERVPWMQFEPSTASVPRGAETSMALIFDSAALDYTPGVYTAVLSVLTSDQPGQNRITLPVTLTVLPSDTSRLEGRVTGRDACGSAEAPLAGAAVEIKDANGSTWNVAANAHGVYSLPLTEWHLPLTVTVAHAGFVSQQLSYAGPLRTVMTLDASLQAAAICASHTAETNGLTVKLAASLAWTSAATFAWDFGDGTTGEGAEVEHTYADFGTYTVTVVATTEQGTLSTTFQVAITEEQELRRVYLPMIQR